MSTQALYEQDFVAWTQQQSRELRDAAGSGVNLPIDWDHVAEEIEDMGKSIRFELRSRLATVIEHLLKLQHSPATEPRSGWRSTVQRSRVEAEQLLEESPSLRPQVAGIIARTVPKIARITADELHERGEIDRVTALSITSTQFTESEILGEWFPKPIATMEARPAS